MALVGDYSPRTLRILPRKNPFGKRSFQTHVRGAWHGRCETIAFGLDCADAQMLFDQWLVLQETVGNQAEFATFARCFAAFRSRFSVAK